jgi:hypothetical protein
MCVDSVSCNGDKMNPLMWVNHFYLMSLLKGPSKLVKTVSVGEKLVFEKRNYMYWRYHRRQRLWVCLAKTYC